MSKTKSKKFSSPFSISNTKISSKEPDGGIGVVYSFDERVNASTQSAIKGRKNLNATLEKKESKA